MTVGGAVASSWHGATNARDDRAIVTARATVGDHVGEPEERQVRRRRGLVWPMTIALSVTALLPLLLVALLVISSQERALSDRLSADLEALADAQQARLQLVSETAGTAAGLVASRTQLRSDLAEVAAGDLTNLTRLETILGDAQHSTSAVRQLTLTDRGGAVLVSTDPAPPPLAEVVAPLDPAVPERAVMTVIGPQDARRWLVACPLLLDDTPIGGLVLELDLAPVAAVVSSEAGDGLGITSCVYHRSPDGDIEPVVAPASMGDPDCTRRSSYEDAPAGVALRGEDRLLTVASDVWGEPVVAATRYLPDLDWGLTVVVPAEVLYAPVRSLTRNLLAASVVVGALAVATSMLVSRWLTGPVRSLQAAAWSLEHGARERPAADASAPGELGELGAAFNTMITAVEHRQSTLELERSELEERYTDLELLSHAMAHDLKGPLTSIRGMLELLTSGRITDGEHREELIDRAIGAARRMERLIDDLLVLLGAIGAPLQLQPVDLSQIVDEVTANLGLGRVLTRTALPTVAGDPVLLDHVVANLLTNAATYHRQGQPARIEITAREHDDHIALIIDDAGPGIAEDERPRVLEPFFRGSAGRAHRGTGLGVPIAARVAKRHGGSLQIDDSPLGGARITVRLPRVSAPEVADPAPWPSPSNG